MRLIGVLFLLWNATSSKVLLGTWLPHPIEVDGRFLLYDEWGLLIWIKVHVSFILDRTEVVLRIGQRRLSDGSRFLMGQWSWIGLGLRNNCVILDIFQYLLSLIARNSILYFLTQPLFLDLFFIYKVSLVVDKWCIFKITHWRVFQKFPIVDWIWILHCHCSRVFGYSFLIQCKKYVKVLHFYYLIQILCIILETCQISDNRNRRFGSSMTFLLSLFVFIHLKKANWWRFRVNNLIVDILLRLSRIIEAKLSTRYHARKHPIAQSLLP